MQTEEREDNSSNNETVQLDRYDNKINYPECICGEQLIKIEDKRFNIRWIGECKINYPECICGEQLMRIEDKRFNQSKYTFWHCNNNDMNNIHIDGFNICNNCINKYDKTLIAHNYTKSSTIANTVLEKHKHQLLCHAFVKLHSLNIKWPNEINILCSLFIGNIFIPISPQQMHIFGLKSINDKLSELASMRFNPKVTELSIKFGQNTITAGTLIFGPPDIYREFVAKSIATKYELDYFRVSAETILERYEIRTNDYDNRSYFENIWSNLEITAKFKNKGCVLWFYDLDIIYFDSTDNSLKNFLLHFFLNNLYNNYLSQERKVFVIVSINNIQFFDSWLALNKMEVFCLDLPDLHCRLSLLHYLLYYPSSYVEYKIDQNIDLEFISKKMQLYSRGDIETFVNTLKTQALNGYISNENVRKLLGDFQPTITKEQYEQYQKHINEYKKYKPNML